MQFSKDRLAHMIAYSPYIQQVFVDHSVQQQVRAKEFKNGSMIFLRSCFHTADGVRGITADNECIDEVQDILADNIPVIEECSARKAPRTITYTGTPKTFDNTIAQLWNKSSQCYWAVKCTHCNHWNFPLGMDNIHDEYLMCSKCHKEIYAITGRYVAMYPDREFIGYHVSQLMLYGVPGTGLPWKRVIEKRDDPMYGLAKFTNECLGFSYDQGAKLITEADLLACSNTDLGPMLRDRIAAWGIRIVCAGVDWGVLGGNTHTVLTIGGLNEEGKLHVFFAKKFPVDQDPVDQVEEVLSLINGAGCLWVAADRGGGHTANAFLRKGLAWGKLHEIEYKPKVLRGMEFNPKSKSWITDRTRAMAGMIIDIKMKRFLFHGYGIMKPFFDDLLTLTCEYNDNLRAYQILRNIDVPDDFAHALTYLRIAAKKIAPRPDLRVYELEEFIAPVA
jgi:hypothetical protein